ncbi:MAG TPA: metal-sensitive transcriptional regulator [Longimicrobiales bacterium]
MSEREAPEAQPRKQPSNMRAREGSPLPLLACGCGVADGERKAVAVDPAAKARNLKRLRRIEGQVRGLQKMIEDDRYCADIMTQISSVHEALRAVGRELMRNHLRHCAASAIRAGEAEAEAMYDELLGLMYKHVR